MLIADRRVFLGGPGDAEHVVRNHNQRPEPGAAGGDEVAERGLHLPRGQSEGGHHEYAGHPQGQM